MVFLAFFFATMTAISALCFSWMGAYFLRFANVGMHGPSIFHLTLLSLVGLFLCLTFAYLGRVSWGILEISLIGFGSVAVGCFYVTQEYLAGVNYTEATFRSRLSDFV